MEIIEKNGNFLKVEVDGVVVSFYKKHHRIVRLSRYSVRGSTYLDPARYAQMIEFVREQFNMPYCPVSYTMKAIRDRERKQKQNLLNKGAQIKLPL